MRSISETITYINSIIAKLFKTTNIEAKLEKKYQHSDELEKKLALLIKDIDSVDNKDLKRIEYKKIDKQIENNLVSTYRLDFHTRDELYLFKKKYKSLIL